MDAEIIATFQELEYPTTKPKVEKHIGAASTSQQAESSISQYQPPPNVAMGPPDFPPASRTATQPIPTWEGYTRGRYPKFKGGFNNKRWQLPSAQSNEGAMFIMPEQLGLFNDTFARWESITKNHVAAQGFTDPSEKLEFIENLLGESEKLTWM